MNKQPHSGASPQDEGARDKRPPRQREGQSRSRRGSRRQGQPSQHRERPQSPNVDPVSPKKAVSQPRSVDNHPVPSLAQLYGELRQQERQAVVLCLSKHSIQITEEMADEVIDAIDQTVLPRHVPRREIETPSINPNKEEKSVSDPIPVPEAAPVSPVIQTKKKKIFHPRTQWKKSRPGDTQPSHPTES